ncbi:pentatricopeptide repeat-containing protein chloroplastic-like, partial [Trifolium medium]|nr:pentatricopeptide repeat-containing protein chloroplastic-like [Trifolium medium]
MPQLVKHGPFQSHPCCYTSHVSSRLPVSFVSLNPSNNPAKDIKSYNNNDLIQSLCRGGNLKQAVQ